ncbi:MAG: sulfotransferase [Hydrogenophilaceae bacterium]|nr:sulfotransferase [Hydrogenophilaceae bacterium]
MADGFETITLACGEHRTFADFWLPRSAEIEIMPRPYVGGGLTATFTLTSGDERLYDYFPYTVWISVDGVDRAIASFDQPHQTRRVEISNIHAGAAFAFESELGARPSARGLGADVRELAVRVESVALERQHANGNNASPLLAATAGTSRLKPRRALPPGRGRVMRAARKYSADLPAAPRPIFVVGCYRSATSALTWAIGQHPCVFAMEETNWLAPLVIGGRAAFRMASGAERSAMELYDIDEPEFCGAIGQAVHDLCIRSSRQRLIAGMLQGDTHPDDPANDGAVALVGSRFSPKTQWVDGTPEYVGYVNAIRSVFPLARFIAIVRNPSEVVRSLLSMDAKVGRDATKESAFEVWETMTQFALQSACELGGRDMCVVPFETLVNDSAGAMAAIWDFLDLPQYDAAASVFERRINSSFSGDQRPDLGKFHSERHDEIYHRALGGDDLRQLPWRNAMEPSEGRLNHLTERFLDMLQGRTDAPAPARTGSPAQ